MAYCDITKLFLLVTTGAFVHTIEASHTVGAEYLGSGYVSIDTVSEIKDTENNGILCAISGTTYVDIVWKWRNVRTKNPDYYFTWGTTKVTIGSHLSSSLLIFKEGLSDADKKDASGVIYAEGEHDDDSSMKTACNDVSLTVIWTPDGKPSLSERKTPLVIEEDNTAELTCQLTDKGNPVSHVRWVKNGNLQNESEYNTEMISIPVTKDINGDKWQCYYSNTAGDGAYSDEVIINVYWKPEKPLLSAHKSPLVSGEDSMAQLTCSLTEKGNPGGQVRWIKNGILHSEPEYNTQIVNIPLIRDIDGDKWQCYYYNAAGDGAYSDEVILNVQWKPEGTPSLSVNKNISLLEGDSSTQLTCQLTDKGNPESQVRWVKNGNLQSALEYNTQIINIPVTKDINGDKWQCYYYNAAGDGDYSYEVVINVYWQPEGTPSLSVNKNHFLYNRDTEAELTCQSLMENGNPVGKVRWVNNGNLQSESEYNTKTIRIPVTKDIDGDRWQCYYYNAAGDGDYSGEVMINVHWRPGTATILSDPRSPNLDQLLTFTCIGDQGNPRSTLFYKNTLLTRNISNSRDYKINKASEDENGNWSCMFSNYLGDGDKSENIAIKVQLTPKLPGNVTTKRYTAVCFVIFVDPGTISPNLRQTYTNMSISWRADKAVDQNKTVILPANTTKYIVYDLEENTNYTIEVYYINHQGTGATATAFVRTKEFPHKKMPVIERSWFSAVAMIDITNPESVSRIDMLVCGSEDDVNCVNKSTTNIAKGDFEVKLTSLTGRYVNVSLYDYDCLVLTHSGNIDAPVAAIVIITLGCILLIGLTIVIIVVIIKKQDKKRKSEEKARAGDGTDTYAYSNPTMVTNTMSGTGTGPPKALNAPPVYAEVNRGRQLAPLAVSADGDVYSQVDWSKKNARQSLKGLPMSKKAIDRIIFHQKDGYVNMIFQVRKKFTGEIEIGVCRVGDQSCTSKVSKQQEGGSKDVVMVLPIEEMSPESYSIHMKFIERRQVTQTVDLTYPYNKNLVKVAVLNEVYGTTASHNDRQTNVVPQRPPRQGAPGEGVTYAVMDWNRSQAPGRPPRLSSRSPAQEHVVYADVRPGGNVY